MAHWSTAPPIKKEAMVKPGHTLTIGPLTFRADYEPADSFMSSDEPAPAPNGAATAADIATASATTATASAPEEPTGDIGAAEERDAATITQTAKPSDTPGELEFEEFSVDDLAELDIPAAVGGGDDAEADEAVEVTAPAANASEAAVADASAPTADEEVSFDDGLGVEFDLDELGGDELGDAPAAEEDGDLSLDITEETSEAAPAVAAAETDDIVADFDLSEEAAPEAAPPANKAADSLDNLLDDDLGFDLKDVGEPAADTAESDEAADDLGFTLEDLEESPAEAAPEAAPAAEADEGADDALTFDLAGAEASEESTDQPAKDAGSKLKLGEEQAGGGDSDMSRFMKELGL